MLLLISLFRARLFCLVAHTILVLTIRSQNVSICHRHTQSLPTALCAHFAVYNPTKNAVYVLGGLKDTCDFETGSSNLNSNIYKWNLTDETWSIFESGIEKLYSWIGNGNVAVVNNKAHFIGAKSEDGRIHVFNTETESWSDYAYQQVSRFGCLATNGSHIFMADGSDGVASGTRTAKIHIYSIDLHDVSWTASVETHMPTNRGWRYQYCSLIEDELYIFGGSDGYSRLSDIYRLNTQTLQIHRLNITLPEPRFEGVAISVQNFAYLFGGDPASENITAFDATNGTFSTAFITQEAFAKSAALRINNKIYRFGGAGEQKQPLKTIEICDLPPSLSDPTVSPSLSPTSTVSPSQYPTTMTATRQSPTLIMESTIEPTNATTQTPSQGTTSDSKVSMILAVIGAFVSCCVLVFIVMVYRMYRKLEAENEANDGFERADGQAVKRNSKYQIGFFARKVASIVPGAAARSAARLPSFIGDDDASDQDNIELAVVEPAPAVVPVNDDDNDDNSAQETGETLQTQDGEDEEGVVPQ